MNHRYTPFLIASVLLFPKPIHAQERAQETVIEGRAMGMPYRVVVADSLREDQREAIRASVLTILAIADKTFSLYRADSEIMQWNANPSTDWIAISQPLADLVEHSHKFFEATDGAFDPTIRPLAKLWRFDKIDTSWVPPTSNALADCLRIVGMQRIHLRGNPTALKKDHPTIELDLNALVEGWCLDQIAESMETMVGTNFLASLGGEHIGRGANFRGEPWRILIESPVGNAATAKEDSDSPFYVQLSDLSVSTSGTYRSGHFYEGRWFGHVLDARTGYPITRERLLASVVAKSALEADGWSTALLTLDEELSIKTCDKFKIASLLIYETDQGLTQWRSEFGQTHFQSTNAKPTPNNRLEIISAKWLFLAMCLVAAFLMGRGLLPRSLAGC